MYRNEPQLVVLSGRQRNVEKIMRRGYLTPAEVYNYPELMGFIPVLGTIAAAIPAGLSFIGNLLDGIGGGSSGSNSSLVEQQMLLQQQQAEQFNKTLIMIGVGAGALLIFGIITRPRK